MIATPTAPAPVPPIVTKPMPRPTIKTSAIGVGMHRARELQQHIDQHARPIGFPLIAK